MNKLVSLFPNGIKYKDYLIEATNATLVMVLVSAVISIILGLLLGVILVVTGKGKLCENLKLHYVLEKIINIFRSIPFVIIITLFLPFTKFIVGTSIGVKGAIVPMIILSAKVFEEAGLIKLKENAGDSPTVKDIAENPKNIKLVEIEHSQIVRSLDAVDAGIVFVKDAVDAGLDPKKDPIYVNEVDVSDDNVKQYI